ncbi:MAG: ATP-binding cassette domain-containing protein [Elusimicrobiaceae bacterium]
MNRYILEMQNIVKEFPGVRALDGVTFSAAAGEVHALVGENGAGKSTLMKVLSGVYAHGSYKGEIKINGEERRFSSVRDSERAGVVIIYQELALVRQLSVCENIMLGDEIHKNGVIDWPAAAEKAAAALKLVGLDINPDTKVSSLGVGQQQLVEIAKALSKDAKILVLDEPTAALSEGEAEKLLSLIKELRGRGVTCVYISHRLKEIFRIADRITVLRDGKTAGTFGKDDLNEAGLIAKMVGREVKDIFPSRRHEFGPAVLDVKNWSASDAAYGMKLKNINFSVRKGEIAGLAGLVGAGRTELAMSLFGVWGRKESGELVVDGKQVPRFTPKALIKAGVALASEDRKRWGLVLIHDVKSNITLSSLDALASFGVVNENAEVSAAEKYVREMAIKTPGLEQKAGNLSGGNQQKIVLSKCLMILPKVLILDEPTRGIDVGAKVEIYGIINRLAEKGVAVLLISSELPEVLGMCDRVFVMRAGRISGEVSGAAASQENIMRYATA